MKPILFVATLVLSLSISCGAFGQEPKKLPPAPDGVTIEQNVAYLAQGREETADLYLPANRAKGVRSPAVVIIHGGGWTGGDKAAAREFNIGTTLALNGYVAISINYALATKDKATWPQNLHDCMTAVRWLRKHAERLQIDPGRIGAIGGSAGGHLAALVGVLDEKDGLDPKGPYGEFSCRVQCAVPMYGPMDLAQLRDISMLGKTREEAPDLYRAASPVTYVRKHTPPMLILHGTADKTVDIKQSELFAAALKKVGAVHELVIVDGAPHTFHLQPKQRDLRPVVLGFFDKHLRADDKERPLKVFVLAGTSNMLGATAKIDNLPEDLRQPLKDVLVYKNGEWTPLEAGKNLVGNEATFGRAMTRHLGEPIGIIWISVASASGKSPAAGINNIVKQAREKGRPIVIAGMLLDVSFRDGNKEETAKSYGENLTRWIESTRKEIGNADLPIVMNRAIPPVASTPYLELVRKAQDAAKLPNFRVFNCDDVSRGGDKVHFNTEGRLEMGRRFAAGMIELMKADK